MIILNGNSLGARQKDLNEKVNEAMKSNVSFDTCEIDPGKTETDADILFKIDLAAKCKNVNYILEVLKSNNSLYICRALRKCIWLGDDEFNTHINVKNLHENMFPHMSIKMKKKLFYSLSMYLTDVNQASSFHEYCIEEKLFDAATKFLVKASESYKQDVIQQQSKAFKFIFENQVKYLVQIIGDSLHLARVYLTSPELNESLLYRNHALSLLRHLYSVSEVQYLDLLEKYTWPWWFTCNDLSRLGRRLSRNIMKSHKLRVSKNAWLYMNILDKNIISRNITVNEVKKYAVELLPHSVYDFWYFNYPLMYNYILDFIPVPKRFSFVKKIFSERYANKPFETCFEFYNNKSYNLMTSEEKEEWALQHIASGKELLGSGNDYEWYKFVNFNKAFEEIKKHVLVTSDADTRLKLLQVLVHSAKSQNDLETLLNYYYNRHVNERQYYKESFLNCLIKQHKVLNFNEECWTALEKLFYSLEVFNKHNFCNCNSDYRVIAVLYYILRKDVVLEVLNYYIDRDYIFFRIVIQLISDLSIEENEAIYQYFLKFYLSKVEALCKEPSNEYNENKILRYVDLTLDLLNHFKKCKDSVPDLINKYIKLNWETVNTHSFFNEPEHKFSENDILKYMKNDAVQIVNEFTKIKKYVEAGNYTNWLVWKLKIYFQHDIAHQYLQLVLECLSSDQMCYSFIECAVYTIIKLANESFKVDFIEKYAPSTAKIDFGTIPQNTLDIQRALCRVSCFSGPPLPMKTILQFIIGDYVKYCLPIFNSYCINIPHNQSAAFIEALIDKPVSVHKHGVRLAFMYFSTKNLVTFLRDSWNKSMNAHKRKHIYKTLFNKVVQESGQTQIELFEVLKSLTLDLHEDDDHKVFEFLNDDRMNCDLRVGLILCAWEVVKTFPQSNKNSQRITHVITAIGFNYSKIPQDIFIVMTNEHVSNILDYKQILNTDLNESQKLLYDKKWQLAARYLTGAYDEDQIKRNLDIIKHITKKVIEMWDEVCQGKYVLREFNSFFLGEIERITYYYNHTVESYHVVKTMYSTILKMLQDALPEKDIYLLTWQLRLREIALNIIITSKNEFGENLNQKQLMTALKASIDIYAEAVVGLIKEYIQIERYFASLLGIIENLITDGLYKIYEQIEEHGDSYNLLDLYVMLCTSLIKYEIPEVYKLLVNILPVKYSKYDDELNTEPCNNQCDGDIDNTYYPHHHPSLEKDYKHLLEMIKTIKNDEVQAFIYRKFELCDSAFE